MVDLEERAEGQNEFNWIRFGQYCYSKMKILIKLEEGLKDGAVEKYDVGIEYEVSRVLESILDTIVAQK